MMRRPYDPTPLPMDTPDTLTSSAASTAERLDPRDIALRVFACVGLSFSAMLFIDYLRVPVFCADHGSGCDAVRNSPYARVLGIPLPIPGIAFFIAALVASCAPFARRALGMIGGIGVAAGAALIAIQALVVHAWCKYCLVVDASALSVGVLALSLARSDAMTPFARGRGTTVAFGAAALVLPLGYGLMQPAALPPNTPVIEAMPEAIAREQVPGKATIVEFIDFECPFCRRQQEALAPVLASYGERVRLVRRNVPLAAHPHARDAARAACCAEEQGRGDRVSEALFRAEDLTPEGCERIAREAGVDVAAYRACLASQRPDVRLERDHNDARASRVGGLPTLWIGREKFEGYTSPEVLRASIDRATRAASVSDNAAQGAHRGT